MNMKQSVGVINLIIMSLLSVSEVLAHNYCFMNLSFDCLKFAFLVSFMY